MDKLICGNCKHESLKTMEGACLVCHRCFSLISCKLANPKFINALLDAHEQMFKDYDEADAKALTRGELAAVASAICFPAELNREIAKVTVIPSPSWRERFMHMTYKERLISGAALLIKELERLEALEETPAKVEH